ncbi:MAG: hypothetical protein N4A45_07810 [Flavobacteriales bacterium]|jgi:hypothetical protein|nr:hypothetical protein [Flavobacteriales bacterium]
MKKHSIMIHENFEKQFSKKTVAIQKDVSVKVKSLSALSSSDLQSFLMYVVGLYQNLIFDLHKSIQWAGQLKEYLQLKAESEEKVEVLQEEKKQLEEKIRKHRLNSEKEDIAYLSHVMKRWKFIVVIIALLLVSETGFNVKAFQVVSSNLLIATLMSAGLGICLIFSAHFVPKIVNKYAKNLLQKVMFWIISIGVMAIIFYFIGEMRMAYFTVMNDQNAYGITSTHFVAINIIFFICASMLSSFYAPTVEQRQTFLKNQKSRELFTEYQKRIKEIDGELSMIPKELSEKENLVSSLLIYIHEQERLIDGSYQETLRTALLELELQTGKSISKIEEIPSLTMKYESTNYEDYV